MLNTIMRKMSVALSFASVLLFVSSVLAQPPVVQEEFNVPTPVDQAQAAQQYSSDDLEEFEDGAQPQPYSIQNQAQAAQQQYNVPTQPQAAQAQGRQIGRVAAGNSNQQIISDLRNLLNNHAARGQFPHNNAFLADVDKLILKYSSVPKPKIKVTNSGPGVLRITFASGSVVDLQPNFIIDLDVGKSQIQLEAQFQDTFVTLDHKANGPARFWDQDDRRHYTINAPNFGGVSQPHQATLTPGVHGHHLEQ